jgi:hypothetical protein
MIPLLLAILMLLPRSVAGGASRELPKACGLSDFTENTEFAYVKLWSSGFL